MDNIQAVTLGFLQGITEWLPISSEGQIILAGIHLFGITPQEALSYAIFLHLGTLFVVLIRFREKWTSLFFHSDKSFLKQLITVTCGTMVTGIPLLLLIKEFFTSGEGMTLLIGCLLVVTGVFLWYAKPGIRDISSMSQLELFFLGLIQGFAILPGISRSGVTITTLLLRNVHPSFALPFSFLISVPPVFGALLLNGLPHSFHIEVAGLMLITAFITGWIMMELLLRISNQVKFSTFCFFLGGITIFAGLI